MKSILKGLHRVINPVVHIASITCFLWAFKKYLASQPYYGIFWVLMALYIIVLGQNLRRGWPYKYKFRGDK